jgi:hypothetical protein
MNLSRTALQVTGPESQSAQVQACCARPPTGAGALSRGAHRSFERSSFERRSSEHGKTSRTVAGLAKKTGVANRGSVNLPRPSRYLCAHPVQHCGLNALDTLLRLHTAQPRAVPRVETTCVYIYKFIPLRPVGS